MMLARRLLTRWETLSPGRQFRVGYLLSVVVLAVFHLGGIAIGVFPNLHVWLACFYAISESLLVAGILVLATQSELARRRAAERQTGDSTPPPRET
jgi:hypothetical protein